MTHGPISRPRGHGHFLSRIRKTSLQDTYPDANLSIIGCTGIPCVKTMTKLDRGHGRIYPLDPPLCRSGECAYGTRYIQSICLITDGEMRKNEMCIV